MTLPAFAPTNTNIQVAASKRLTPWATSHPASVVWSAAPSPMLVKAIVVFAVYRAALKRLEAEVEGNLFDEPVFWAEIKSVAWAEAGEAAEQRKHQLPLIGACASAAGFFLAISAAVLWTL